MSDYLDNLVSRTFNQTPAVKPRLASIYEPFSVSVSDRDTSLLDLEISSEEQPVTREPFKNTSADPQLNSRLPELPEPLISHSRVTHSLDQERSGLNAEENRAMPATEPNAPLEPTARLTHAPPRKLIHEPASKASAESLPGLTKEPASIAAVDSQDVRAMQPPNVGVVRPSTRKVQKPAPAITSSSIGEPDQTLASDLRLKGTLVSKSQPPAVPETINVSTGTALTRLISTLPKGHQSLDIISHRNSVSEPAPEGAGKISVTIGRVDVRAIFTQPQADRSERPKKSTAMSLDDYLKQRTGGRR